MRIDWDTDDWDDEPGPEPGPCRSIWSRSIQGRRQYADLREIEAGIYLVHAEVLHRLLTETGWAMVAYSDGTER